MSDFLGNITIHDSKNKLAFNLHAEAGLTGSPAGMWIGRSSADGGAERGLVSIRNDAGAEAIVLDGTNGLIIADHLGKVVLTFAPEANLTGKPAGLWLGRSTADGGGPGLMVLRNAAGADSVVADGAAGAVSLNNAQGKPRITLDGSRAYGALGGNGWDGGLALFPAAATNNGDWKQATMTFNGQAAAVGIGGAGHAGSINVNNAAGQGAIAINGDSGDIFLLNADCAEDFDLAEQIELSPGTVVVLADDGSIRQSTSSYDRRVAGVLSGAGDFKPGLVLDRKPSLNTRAPVALMGKVYCKVDASHAPIAAGDLLTTSSTPGHAMRAVDQTQAFGAVIGKALRALSQGQALIPILVTLQ